VGLLRDQETTPLGGRMAALLVVASMLPRQVFYEAQSQAYDQQPEYEGDAFALAEVGEPVPSS
jgi:hypothetical protein